jgi:uncharacterized protein YjaZ
MLKIISAYLGMKEYIRTARQMPEVPLDEIWWIYAVAPFWGDWAAGQFNEPRLQAQFSTPITALDDLAVEVDLLAQSGVEQLVESAYTEISAALPPCVVGPVVCIYALDPADKGTVERRNGVAGSGVGNNTLLQINPLAQDWQAWVPFVLAHEYHHSAWGYHYFYLQGHTSADLLTTLLIEGQADWFAHALYPGLRPSWDYALTPAQEAGQWRRMQPHLASSDAALHAGFMFGDEHTPWCTGYTIGYHIIEAYMRAHPGVLITDLFDKDAHELLADSGYPVKL